MEFRGETSRRPYIVAAVFGGVLALAPVVVYQTLIGPPDPPYVDGAGEVYVSDAEILLSLRVTVDPARTRSDRSEVTLDLVFLQMAGKAVDWAVVLYRQARFVSPALPPGATVHATRAGDPPFRDNPKEDVQVITGTTSPRIANGEANAVQIKGWIPAVVVTEKWQTFSLALPRYGRVHLSPLFTFPQAPGALDIGAAGTWARPEKFEVIVDAGPNDPNERVDLASPDVADPTLLRWESDEAVRVVLRRTDLEKEAQQQAVIFALGALVGAGASTIVVAVERLLIAVRLRPPPPAGGASGSSPP